jgi:ABC-type polysaccharide/polyol phosphate export permease
MHSPSWEGKYPSLAMLVVRMVNGTLMYAYHALSCFIMIVLIYHTSSTSIVMIIAFHIHILSNVGIGYVKSVVKISTPRTEAIHATNVQIFLFIQNVQLEKTCGMGPNSKGYLRK